MPDQHTPRRGARQRQESIRYSPNRGFQSVFRFVYDKIEVAEQKKKEFMEKKEEKTVPASSKKKSVPRVKKGASKKHQLAPVVGEKKEKKKKQLAKKKKSDDEDESIEWTDRKVEALAPISLVYTEIAPTEEEVKLEKERVAAVAQEVLMEKHRIVLKEFKEGLDRISIKLEQNEGRPRSKIPAMDSNIFENMVPFEFIKFVGVPTRTFPEPTHQVLHTNFYEPLSESVPGYEELQLTHAPYVSDNTDDLAVCSRLYKVYPAGIHGYEPNKTEMSNEILFNMMKKLLPTTKNPDLLYHTIYTSYMSTGNQLEISRMFPRLVKFFVQNPQEAEELLALEPWKMQHNEHEKKGIALPVTTGNYTIKTIQISTEPSDDPCSEECYKSLCGAKLYDFLGKHSIIDGNLVELYIMKSCSAYVAPFINALLMANKEKMLSDFCNVANRHSELSCQQWFRRLLDSSKRAVNGKFKDDAKLNYSTLRKKFLNKFRLEEQRYEKANESKLAVKVSATLSKCSHHGPCGFDVPYCSCQGICTIDCNCNINCPLRFTGCRCTKDCRTASCPCAKLGQACDPRTCLKCELMPGRHTFCKNMLYGKQTKALLVTVRESTVVVKKPFRSAGNGAFLEEHAEKGDFLGDYVGEIISTAETERRGRLYELGISYVFELPEETGSIDATRAGNVLRYLNHSETPNCQIRYRREGGQIKIGFFTSKAVDAGEELFINYNYSKGHAKRFFGMEPAERVPTYSQSENQKKVNKAIMKKKVTKKELIKVVKKVAEEMAQKRWYHTDSSTNASTPQTSSRGTRAPSPIVYVDPSEPGPSNRPDIQVITLSDGEEDDILPDVL